MQYYNGPLSISQLKDFLLDIQVTRVSETERINTAITGTLGAQLFHDALVSVSNGYLTVDSNFINKISSDTSTPHLAFGAQFTRYNGPHGLQVNMMLNSMNDSRKYSKIMHPLYPNLPVDSARMTFLNLGSTEGQPNMAILKVKDSYRWGFRAGTHTPTGPVKGGQVSALTAGYDVFCEGTAGLMIRDASSMGEFIYDVNY